MAAVELYASVDPPEALGVELERDAEVRASPPSEIATADGPWELLGGSPGGRAPS